MSQQDTAQLSRTTADKAVRDRASLLPKRSILLKTQQKTKPHAKAGRVALFFAVQANEPNKHRGSL
jgi:hypothetical protein